MGTVRTTEQFDTASSRVLEAVAQREGNDPVEFDRRLFDVVDPDALDALVGSGFPGTVTFEYLGYRVTVHGTGRVDVTDPTE